MAKVAEAETGIKPQDTAKVDQLDSSDGNNADLENNDQEDDAQQSSSSANDTAFDDNSDDSTAAETDFANTTNKSKRADSFEQQNYDDTGDANESAPDDFDNEEKVVFVDSIADKVARSQTQAQNNKRLDEKTIVMSKPRKARSRKLETIIYYE